MSDVLLRDLIDIPTSVHKSDFVISLERGVTDAQAIVGTYVVTDQLVGCFDRALGLIASAVETGASKGAYLHGSFGSGKSHFMAVLHLLCEQHPAARAIPELAPVVARHDPRLRGRRFLLVPIHMIGAKSMEAGILGGYVEVVRQRHPDATLPAVFLADGLLADARRLREQMGDEGFFAGLGGDDEDFGDLAPGWDATSFDAALAAPPASGERDRLVSDLIHAYFSSQVGVAEATAKGYVPFDDGLAAISRHARGLGYDAVVLFCDELILWFASLMGDQGFVNAEGPKVAKLVEAGMAARPAPVVSFIARQRDLRDFVGQGIPGADRINFGEILEWWEGRFDTIELADRNLPAIVSKRLLQPNSVAARQQLDAAFARTVSDAGRGLDTLLTSAGDREMFRRVYPFSPALVEALVAVSGYLQRERTALRLLLQLLVDRREELTIGDLVPLGDLYDVIAAGDEPFSDELKRHFGRARAVYRQRFRPLLLAEHGLTGDEAAILSDGHPFRTDDRLVKTLLLAALAPEVEPLRALTVRRLAELNHGTIRSPIRGQERATVLGKVKRWAAEVGELRIDGDDQDPVVTLRLTGVATEAILDQARGADSLGARRAKIRELLAGALPALNPSGQLPHRYTWVWRGSRRTVEVRFANVRDHADIPSSEFRAGDVPRVVIDFPFDEPGWVPADDLARVHDELIDEVGPTPTVCWLPLFLTEQALDRLGALVVVDFVLVGDRFASFTTHLSPQDRAEARQILENQARALRAQVTDHLHQAYGLTTPDETWVQTAIQPAQQFPTLDPTLTVRPPTASTMQPAFEQLLDQAMAHRYPAHPRFEDEVYPGDLRITLRHVTDAVQAEYWRLDEVPANDRRAVRKVVAPLRLGQVGERHLVPERYWIERFHRLAAEHPGQPVTVERLRSWMDVPQAMGLDHRVGNLVICAYALQTDRVLIHAGRPVAPTVDRLDPATELRTQELPTQAAWDVAVDRAARVFGLVASPVLTASSVAALVAQLRDRATATRQPCRSLADALRRHAGALRLGDDAARLRTALAARDLIDGLAAADDADAVEVLARAAVPTSAEALGRSIAAAAEVARTLDAANWDLISQAGALGGDWRVRARGMVELLSGAARADELAEPLPAALGRATAAATDLLGRAATAAIATGGTVLPSGSVPVERTAASERAPAPAGAVPVSGSRLRERAGSRQGLTGAEARDVLAGLLARADELEALDVRWTFRR